MKNKDAKELKVELAKTNQFLKEIFANQTEMDKLEISAKYEGICRILRLNLMGLIPNTIALSRLRDIVEGRVPEPF